MAELLQSARGGSTLFETTCRAGYAMTIERLTTQALEQINDQIAVSLSAEDQTLINRAIAEAVTEAVRLTSQRCSNVATGCCGSDRELSEKIALEVDQASAALIANLSALR